MRDFKLVDTNRFYLKTQEKNRFLHICSVQRGMREFVCFIDQRTNQCYIEEITGGHLDVIKEDSLHSDLSKFIDQKRLLHIRSDIPMEEQPFRANKLN